MGTKPIFDFIREVRKPSIKIPCSAEEIDHYERNVLLCLLYDMKACLTDCLLNNPNFDVSFIREELWLLSASWKAKETIVGGITTEKESGVIAINLQVQQLWAEKPETRIPDLMLSVIEEAERFVNRDYLGSPNDNAVEITARKISRKDCVEEKSVLNGKEVAELFGIPLNNVKDKQWRDRNGFPYSQISRGGKVVFYTDEVKAWLENRGR